MAKKKAIDKVLGSSPTPLHYNEITERIISEGLRKNIGATPAATVNTQISSSIKHDGDSSPYIRVSKAGDVDIFLLMEDSFDSAQVRGEAAIIFDHLAGHNVEGASVFWIRRQAAIGGEQAALEHWQLKRDKPRRGIVEVISDDSERSRT